MVALLRRRLAALVLLVGVAALTACGSSDHNDADVAFATGMVPHHAQAVEMADLADDRAQSEAVLDLADTIRDAQQPEIDAMTGWLEQWDEPAPATDAMGSMGGMMSGEQMDALGAASGPAFDRMWVELMIEHHEGALTMAQEETASGQDADAKALAASITTSQTAEIATMRGLLETLPG